MTILTAYTRHQEIAAAVQDIYSAFIPLSPKLVIFFASSSYAMTDLADSMKKAFSPATVIGCSTAGELTSGKMLNHAIVAMAFSGETVSDVSVAVIEDVHDKQKVASAFATFEQHFQQPVSALDISQYVGIILVDGLSRSEEKLMEKIGDRTDIAFIGGSAGDDLKFKATTVSADGKVFSNAAVLALLHVPQGFEILKTQSLTITDTKLVATKVDEENRIVLEFNDEPAVQAYARAVGSNVAGAALHFMESPLGLIIDGEPFVRSPQQVKGNSMVFFCNVKQGMELSLLSAGDIVSKTQKDLNAKKQQIGKIAGVLNFHCILRTLELNNKGQTQAYADIFTGIPTAGFSTYGEEYIGHMNQTSTMLLFK